MPMTQHDLDMDVGVDIDVDTAPTGLDSRRNSCVGCLCDVGSRFANVSCDNKARCTETLNGDGDPPAISRRGRTEVKICRRVQLEHLPI